jgi:hypothetical protein
VQSPRKVGTPSAEAAEKFVQVQNAAGLIDPKERVQQVLVKGTQINRDQSFG